MPLHCCAFGLFNSLIPDSILLVRFTHSWNWLSNTHNIFLESRLRFRKILNVKRDTRKTLCVYWGGINSVKYQTVLIKQQKCINPSIFLLGVHGLNTPFTHRYLLLLFHWYNIHKKETMKQASSYVTQPYKYITDKSNAWPIPDNYNVIHQCFIKSKMTIDVPEMPLRLTRAYHTITC